MNSLARTLERRYINVGTPLVLMGTTWLYVWVFHWMDAYFYDPRWGHNYLEAAAFLIVGLAYFNRRLVSDVIALVAATMIVPVSLELLPHWATASTGLKPRDNTAIATMAIELATLDCFTIENPRFPRPSRAAGRI